MATVNFDVAGAAGPIISRTTNVPVPGNFAFGMEVQITSYEDFAELLGIELNNGNWFYLEGDVSGTLNAIQQSGGGPAVATRQIWNDGRTSWNYIAGSLATTTLSLYVLSGGVWTVLTPLTTTNFTPTRLVVGGSVVFASTSSGIFNYGTIKIWSAQKSEAILRAEAFSRKPRDWSSLTFWNPALLASSINIDRSGNGGNMTLTGTPTDVTSDPGIPWQR